MKLYQKPLFKWACLILIASLVMSQEDPNLNNQQTVQQNPVDQVTNQQTTQQPTQQVIDQTNNQQPPINQQNTDEQPQNQQEIQQQQTTAQPINQQIVQEQPQVTETNEFDQTPNQPTNQETNTQTTQQESTLTSEDKQAEILKLAQQQNIPEEEKEILNNEGYASVIADMYNPDIDLNNIEQPQTQQTPVQQQPVQQQPVQQQPVQQQPVQQQPVQQQPVQQQPVQQQPVQEPIQPLPQEDQLPEYCNIPSDYTDKNMTNILNKVDEIVDEETKQERDDPKTINVLIQDYTKEVFNTDVNQASEVSQRLLRLFHIYKNNQQNRELSNVYEQLRCLHHKECSCKHNDNKKNHFFLFDAFKIIRCWKNNCRKLNKTQVHNEKRIQNKHQIMMTPTIKRKLQFMRILENTSYFNDEEKRELSCLMNPQCKSHRTTGTINTSTNVSTNIQPAQNQDNPDSWPWYKRWWHKFICLFKHCDNRRLQLEYFPDNQQKIRYLEIEKLDNFQRSLKKFDSQEPTGYYHLIHQIGHNHLIEQQNNFVRNLSKDKNSTTYSRLLAQVANKFLQPRNLQNDDGLQSEDIVQTQSNVIEDLNSQKIIEKDEFGDQGINIAMPVEEKIEVIPYEEEVTDTGNYENVPYQQQPIQQQQQPTIDYQQQQPQQQNNYYEQNQEGQDLQDKILNVEEQLQQISQEHQQDNNDEQLWTGNEVEDQTLNGLSDLQKQFEGVQIPKIDINEIQSQIPECLTNKDIRENGYPLLEQLKVMILQQDSTVDHDISPLIQQIENMQAQIHHGTEISPEEFRAILDQGLHDELNKTDELLQDPDALKRNFDKQINELNEVKQQLNVLLPPNSSLDQDFNKLINNIEHQQELIEQQWQNEDEETRKIDVAQFKAFIQDQDKNINDQAQVELIHKISQKLDDVVGKESTLGGSLNEGNLKGIFHKVLLSAYNDVDKLKQEDKPSGLFLDVDDLNKLSDQVIEELKHEQGEHIQQDVVQFHELQRLIDELNPSVYNKDECNKQKLALKSLINLQIQQEKILNEAINSPETKQNITNLMNDYHQMIQQIGFKSKPLVEDTDLYKTLTQGLENQQERRLIKHLQAIKLKLNHKMNKDVKFLIDFASRQLMRIQESQNMEDQRKLKIKQEVDEEIRGLEEFLQDGKTDKHLTGFENQCQKRKLGLSDTIDQFKQRVLTMKDDVTKAFQGSEKLTQILANAQNQVEKVKSSLSFGGRRLIMDDLNGMMNLVGDVKKAHDKAKQMTDVLNQAKQYSDNFQNAYSSLLNIAS